jgi:sugar transferase (PEP-CTERM/EpsH1 system associated)
MKWIYATEQRRLLDYERHIAHGFSHALVCTAAEQRDFARLIPRVPVSIVGNGVDLDHFRSAGRAKRPGAMVFTGVMDYLPNVDAVAWLCDEILPLVQAEIPAASLTICGSRPAAAVRRLAQRPGVRVTGWVADTRPYLDEAQLFTAPLRLARGIQNKLLEAMAMGLPCVTSTIAWNATEIAAGEGILAADEPKEFAAHILRLLHDSEYRTQMAGRARGAVEADYRWDMQMARLDRVIAAVTAAPVASASPAPTAA